MEDYVSSRPGDPNVPEKTAVMLNSKCKTDCHLDAYLSITFPPLIFFLFILLLTEPEDSKKKLPRAGPASSAALKILS